MKVQLSGKELDFQIWNLEEIGEKYRVRSHQLIDGTETQKQRPSIAKKNEERGA